MDKDTSEQLPQPTDSPGDEILDTEGHSLLTIDLANATHNERVRTAEKASRENARAREARPSRNRGFFDRLRGR